MILFEEEKKDGRIAPLASIKVVGVGGAGGNTVNSIVASGHDGIECVVANTDAQALNTSKADHKVQIGLKSTKGLGTGANPELGEKAAEEDIDSIMEAIGNADVVFLTGGMGGGTGSGGLPVVARALREKGILSVAVVTKPFLFEGKRRAKVAEEALAVLRKEVDTLLVIPNQRLLDVVDESVSMIDAFEMINDVLCQSVKGISDIITKPGHINVDFSDVRTIMKDKGLAVMGTGRASGPHRAKDAAMQAITSPLLENMSIEGAHAVLLNITGGKDLGLHEISQAASVIYAQAHEDANIIIGSVIDESMKDFISVTIIATGFEQVRQEAAVTKSYVVSSSAASPSAAISSAAISSAASSGVANYGVAKEAAPLAPEMAVTALAVESIVDGESVLADTEDAVILESSATECESADISATSEQVLAAPARQVVEESLLAATAEEEILDVNDLDVPTFMRNKVHENDL
jgi:cell division protein FtsZ